MEIMPWITSQRQDHGISIIIRSTNGSHAFAFVKFRIVGSQVKLVDSFLDLLVDALSAFHDAHNPYEYTRKAA